MQTFYADGIVWTRWESIEDEPQIVVLPLPEIESSGRVVTDIPEGTE